MHQGGMHTRGTTVLKGFGYSAQLSVIFSSSLLSLGSSCTLEFKGRHGLQAFSWTEIQKFLASVQIYTNGDGFAGFAFGVPVWAHGRGRYASLTVGMGLGAAFYFFLYALSDLETGAFCSVPTGWNSSLAFASFLDLFFRRVFPLSVQVLARCPLLCRHCIPSCLTVLEVGTKNGGVKQYCNLAVHHHTVYEPQCYTDRRLISTSDHFEVQKAAQNRAADQ